MHLPTFNRLYLQANHTPGQIPLALVLALEDFKSELENADLTARRINTWIEHVSPVFRERGPHWTYKEIEEVAAELRAYGSIVCGGMLTNDNGKIPSVRFICSLSRSAFN